MAAERTTIGTFTVPSMSPVGFPRPCRPGGAR